jgi:hypothetical protein
MSAGRIPDWNLCRLKMVASLPEAFAPNARSLPTMTDQPISTHWYRHGPTGQAAVYWLGNTGFSVRCWPTLGTLWDRWPWYGVTDEGELIFRGGDAGSLYAAGFGSIGEAKAATLKAFASRHLDDE